MKFTVISQMFIKNRQSVIKWLQLLMKNAHNLHDDEWRERPSLVNKHTVLAIVQNISKQRRLTMTPFSLLNYWNLCARLVSNMFMERENEPVGESRE